MALSEKHRSTLYNQLGNAVGDYDAVGAHLSNFASQELDEPASREFVATQVPTVRTEIQGVRTEIEGVRTEIEGVHTKIAESEVRLTRYVHQELTGFRTEISGIRTEMTGVRNEVVQLRAGVDGLRSDTVRTNQWMIGLVITLVIGLVASQIIG